MEKSPSVSRRLMHCYVLFFAITALVEAFRLSMANPATGTVDVIFSLLFILLLYTAMGYLFFAVAVLFPYLFFYRWLPLFRPLSMPARLGGCSAAVLFMHSLLVYFAPIFLANEHTDCICRACTYAWGVASFFVLLFLLVLEIRHQAESTDGTDDF